MTATAAAVRLSEDHDAQADGEGVTRLVDVSTPTPRLPIEPAKWDSMAFVKRCGTVRVGSHGLKAFYLSLAGLAQPLRRADAGVFRIRLTNMLHHLEIGERAFYRNRRALERQGLVSIRRTAKSTEVRVYARRMLAEAPPWRSPSLADSVEVTESDSVEVTESIDGEYRREDLPGVDSVPEAMLLLRDRARESAPAFEPGSAFLPDDDDDGD